VWETCERTDVNEHSYSSFQQFSHIRLCRANNVEIPVERETYIV